MRGPAQACQGMLAVHGFLGAVHPKFFIFSTRVVRPFSSLSRMRNHPVGLIEGLFNHRVLESIQMLLEIDSPARNRGKTTLIRRAAQLARTGARSANSTA